MLITDIITNKINKGELTHEELKFFIDGVTKDTIPDYQITALLMAIYINGLNEQETAYITKLIANSGSTLNMDKYGLNIVDKHSSGGVGDKVSLIVVPLIASFGIKMAKMSGKGLGHTGGTIDKLDSIFGFNTNLSEEKCYEQLDEIGCFISGQTGKLCPADKKLYALRDVTATVSSIPLIASSIMSKKIASGSKNIILDVKCGSGAFMKNKEDAIKLANEMVKIGANLDRNVIALITDMNEPLGYNIGNALEVIESVDVLKGKYIKDLNELCESICAYALLLTESENDLKTALQKSKENLKNGKALNKFKQMINAQGGSTDFIEDYSLLQGSDYSYEILSAKSGYINEIDCEKAGLASLLLGAGRIDKNSDIDYGAGIILSKKSGDFIKENEPIATLYSSDKEKFKDALNTFNSGVKISEYNSKNRDESIIITVVESGNK